MYMTSPKRKNGSTVVRLVVSFRQCGKVKNKIVKVVGQSKDKALIEQYKQTAKRLIDEHRKGLISLSSVSEKLPVNLSSFLGKERYNDGFEDILGVGYEKLGFNHLIQGGRSSQELNQTLRNLVLMRVFQPVSKLRSCDLIFEHFNKKISHKQVLTMMDRLSKTESDIKERMFQSIVKHNKGLELLLFDVTTLHFESVSRTDLKDFGYSKDGKFNEVQVVLAVLSNAEGLPVSYELFPGNTGEPGTLRKVLGSIVKRHKVKRVCLIADRAMFSEDNFKFFDSWNKQGTRAEYIVACPLRRLPKKIKEDVLNLNNYKKSKEGVLFYKLRYKGRHIVVIYSEKLKQRDEKKRQILLDKLREMSHNGNIPTGKLIKNKGIRKFMEKAQGKLKIDEEKIQEDMKWDGLCGVCTNKENASPAGLIRSYRSLWKIEELFRINKHTLQMRPIYHRLSRRIRAHIMICFLSYTILKWTEITLKKSGLFFSPQELIDILKQVESFIIKDKIKPNSPSYCVPRALSKQAQQIYTAFNKKYPVKTYKME